MAAFYGNALQETQWFTKLSENNPSARYAPWYGRGFLQLTWPNNYIAYWDFKGRAAKVPLMLRTELLSAQNEANRSRSNAPILGVESRLPAEIVTWRDDVGQSSIVDASETAGFYWASLRMACHADERHALERVAIGTSRGPKCYYRSRSFWKTSASVNLPGAINALYSRQLNGFEARCVAYGVVLAVTGEHLFPSNNGERLSIPDDEILRKER
jgi:hypothetical protein